MGSPIADHNEYRPPTQSQNLNILAASIPKAVTAGVLVERATKCLAMCFFYEQTSQQSIRREKKKKTNVTSRFQKPISS